AAPAVCCPGSDDRPQRPVPSFEETMILPRTLTAPRVRALLRALAFALLSLAPLALAQGQAVEPVAGSPEAVADAAVRSWLERVPVGFDQLSRLDAEQLCRELPGLVTAPPPPPGTEVRFDDRVERPVDDADVKVF